MKKMFLLSTLASFAMICSCQRQDSAAEAQLAQRKSELDARETALVEREKTLDARERALAEREKATANTSTIRPELQSNRPELQSPRQIPNAAEAKTERERRIQQLPPEIRALILVPSQVKTESRGNKGGSSDPAEARAETNRSNLSNQRPLSPEDLQREWQRKLDQAQTSGAAMSPAAEDASLTPSPTPQ